MLVNEAAVIKSYVEEIYQNMISQWTLHISPLRANHGVSFSEHLGGNDEVLLYKVKFEDFLYNFFD